MALTDKEWYDVQANLIADQAKSHAAVAEVVEPHVSKIIGQLANITKFNTLEKRGVHEDWIRREPVMAAILIIRDAAYALRTALTHATLAKEAAEKEVGRLKAHAIKYIDPMLGSESAVKDAEDWIENRMARHGEGHHALVGIYPCDMGMLANALKSLRLRLHTSTQRTLSAEQRAAAMEASGALWRLLAEETYGQLRIAKYGDEKNYPVEGALDALFAKRLAAQSAGGGG